MYGWCPSVRNLSKGEVELGLMARITKMRAINCLDFFQGISCAFSKEALVKLAEQSGVSDKQLIKLQVESDNEDMRMNQSWQ